MLSDDPLADLGNFFDMAVSYSQGQDLIEAESRVLIFAGASSGPSRVHTSSSVRLYVDASEVPFVPFHPLVARDCGPLFDLRVC